jgi:hypothetical protein
VAEVARRLLLQRHLEELVLVDVAVARHGRGASGVLGSGGAREEGGGEGERARVLDEGKETSVWTWRMRWGV